MPTLNELLDAIRQVESGGNNRAVSPVGAMGPYQFMPATAKEFGLVGNDVFDPIKARDAAGRKISGLIDEYGGNIEHAIAAYNLGQGNMAKFNNDYTRVPETKNYVNKVLSMLNPIDSANAEEVPQGKLSFEDWKAQRGQEPQIDQIPQGKLSFEEWKAKRNKPDDNILSDIASSVGTAASNFVPDLVQNVIPGVVTGTAQAVSHPIDTAQGLLNLANGALQNVLPEKINALMPDSTKGNKAMASSVFEDIKNAYGSFDAIKNRFEQKPAQMLSDLSLATLAAGKLAKVPELVSLSNTINPISMTGNAIAKGASYVAPKIGSLAAEAIGNLGTHTGADSIREAAKAGKAGGITLKAFVDNMRKNVPMTQVVDDAKSNLNAIKQARSADYVNNIASTSSDSAVLNLYPIKKSLGNAFKEVTFHGVPKNQSAFNTLKEIAEEVKKWNELDKNVYHTPMGLDALKQKIGAIREKIPVNEKTAYRSASNVYNSVKDAIVNQSPEYAKAMAEYEDASSTISELERALSLGRKASVDTTLRKLQKTMRNNVNTNYGNNMDLVNTLEKAGTELMPALAGQSLTSYAPRGIANALYGGSVGAGGYFGGLPGLVAALTLQSPRLMGEASVLTGKASRGAETLAEMARNAGVGQKANLLYQSGEYNEKKKNARR